MTISTWTSRSLLFIAVNLLIFVHATSALAAVRIAGIMYDPPGADEGHEWIQLTNTGTDAVNLAGYRLFEGDTNHKLTVAAGTSTLLAGVEAIIATDPAQYESDHPDFRGTIFKSSFSLSNTGETIALKDAKLAVVDTYSYTAPPAATKPVPSKVASTKKTSYAPGKSSTSYDAGANQAAALPLAHLPSLPEVPRPWLYLAGVVSLILLGATTVLYAKAAPVAVTAGTGEEFELE